MFPDIEYPFSDRIGTITNCGRICMENKKINISTVLAGEKVGITEVDEKIWLVQLMDFDLGYFDTDSCRIELATDPFEIKHVTHVIGIFCYLCERNIPRDNGCSGRIRTCDQVVNSHLLYH